MKILSILAVSATLFASPVFSADKCHYYEERIAYYNGKLSTGGAADEIQRWREKLRYFMLMRNKSC